MIRNEKRFPSICCAECQKVVPKIRYHMRMKYAYQRPTLVCFSVSISRLGYCRKLTRRPNGGVMVMAFVGLALDMSVSRDFGLPRSHSTFA